MARPWQHPAPVRTGLLARLVTLLLTVASAHAEQHDSAVASELKAAFVYNFLQFTAWPTRPDNPTESEITLCVYARGALADSLATLEGKPVENHSLRVKLWPDTPKDCRIVYFSSAAEPQESLILYALRDSVNLTIAEGVEVPTEGVTIGLLEDGEKLAFTVNLETARKHGVKFSSKLLRLARSVYPRPEDEP